MSARIRAPPPSSYSPVSPSDTEHTLAKDGAASTRSSRSSFSFRPSGFKRVFNILQKDSTKSLSPNATPNGRRRGDVGSTRRDSESGVTRIPPSISTPGNTGATQSGGGGGFLYRTRNARSMDALRIFSKSTIKPPPVPHNLSHVTPAERPKSVEKEKDLIPPVLRLQVEEEDEGNASQSSSNGGSSHRPSGSVDIGSSAGKTVPVDSTKPPSTYSGIGGIPPPGALGAVATPATIISPPSPPADSPLVTTQKDQFPKLEGKRNILNSLSNPPASNNSTPKPRPPKPNLSIPIPARIPSHERAATMPTMSPSLTSTSGSPTSLAQNSGTIGRSKVPPSPGFSLRLTPSIIMSRPVWPLPPLPTMEKPPVPPLPASTTSSNGSPSSATQVPKRPIFRIRSPSVTRNSLGRSATEIGVPSNRREPQRMSRSMSVKLDSMPSLSVMGETEHGDPEADDDDMEDVEGEGEGEDVEGDEEGSDEVVVDDMPLGRPSIDSMMSTDSMASVETVRARVVEPSLSTDSSLSAPTITDAMREAKGKGKERQPSVDNEEEAEHSDSDDSLYFDAKDSVIVSPKDVPKMIERRRSQQQSQAQSLSRNGSLNRHSIQLPATARDRFIREGSFARDRSSLPAGESYIRNSLRDASLERHKRDSTWSISTARESVYYTPTEGQSAFHTPGVSGFAANQGDLLRATSTSAFAREVASKRASVPAGFGIPLSSITTTTKDGVVARRGGENRFSLSTLGRQTKNDGLPSVDFSKLGFDPAQFISRTPTPGSSIREKGSSTPTGVASLGSSIPDGLPTSRKVGMPNFDSAITFTKEETDASTPKFNDYFNVKPASASHNPSIQVRRGSVSASATVPESISEDLTVGSDDAELDLITRSVRTASPRSARIGLPLDLASIPSSTNTRTNLTPLSSIPHPHTPGSFPSPASITTRPSPIGNAKRPSVYRQASRSMVELSLSISTDVDEDYKGGLDSTVTPSLSATSPVETKTQDAMTNDPLAWAVPPPSPTFSRARGTIRRVSSFPLLQSSDMPISEKPPPSYHSVPRREEEGKEKLPRYSNDIILAGLLPRKLEFERPGLQARDRSWKKVWCVLQGTMFRVYKVGTLEVKFGALAAAPVAGQLPVTNSSTLVPGGKARHHGSSFSVSHLARSIVTAPQGGVVGSTDTRPRSPSAATALGNSTTTTTTTSDLPSWKGPLNDTSRSPDSVLTKNQQLLAPPSTGLTSPALSINSGNTRSSMSGSSYAPSRSSFSNSRPTTPQTRPTGTSTHSSGNRSIEAVTPRGHGPGGRSLIDNGGSDIYTPAQSSLMRQYSLQHAESGLATDYMKRRNVIRVRLEGQQFLLQLPAVEDVVEWIEGLQAASNIALDLDVRPMPKGALYPRRRRRRRAPRTPGETGAQAASTSTNNEPEDVHTHSRSLRRNTPQATPLA